MHAYILLLACIRVTGLCTSYEALRSLDNDCTHYIEACMEGVPITKGPHRLCFACQGLLCLFVVGAVLAGSHVTGLL
jgi:hypothetical protein